MSVLLVCGGRDYGDRGRVEAVLRAIDPSVVVHGDARGADGLCGAVAERMGIPVVKVPALWAAHGRGAGPRRNVFMLQVAIALAAHHEEPLRFFPFPGGRGTAHMVQTCERAGVLPAEVAL